MGAQPERAARLGALVNGHPEAVSAALPELAAMLRAPDDVHALAATIEALGLAWDPRAAQLLVSSVDPAHPSALVRLALARALPCGVDDEPVRAEVITTLVALTRDVDDDVRDWACFGLGQIEADSSPVRDALAARLDDPHVDTRLEALAALAAVGDRRALEPCLRALSVDPGEVYLLAVTSASALADASLLPALRRLEVAWTGDVEDNHTAALRDALRACGA